MAATMVLTEDDLHGHLSPEMLVCLGYAASEQPLGMRPQGRITWQSLTDWERVPARR